MKNRKIFKALKTQMERAIEINSKDYSGLFTATLAIIQALELTLNEAKEITNYIGFYVSDHQLSKWSRK